MQTDLSDGVRYLAANSLIDPKRVCIVGASYGGYAALAGAAFEPGVYRCAVTIAGISDLRKLLGWIATKTASRDNAAERYTDRFLGASDAGDPILSTLWPLDHVANINVPVLLIHGRDDTVVPFEQSQIMADALNKAGKSVQLVTLKQEDHWLSRSDTRLQMLQATVEFLKNNNPAD
jgi:dipeptidyl aminopeptidase/acylaminoacyl peptidase